MIVSNQQREENFQEYLRLLHDPNYYEVVFDDDSGGVSAIHREHIFDSKKGVFGVPLGEYERNVITCLRKKGHLITLESESAPIGVKTPDGFLDGEIMDIKATDSMGKWSIKKKLHIAASQGAKCAILYFHKKELFSFKRIEDGWDRFQLDKDSYDYTSIIHKVICIVEDEVKYWDIPK